MDVSIIKGTVTVKKAAELIGISSSRLRQMIRKYEVRCPSGTSKPLPDECKAIKVESEMFPAGHAWQVPPKEINRLKNTSLNSHGGRPRTSEVA